MKKNKPETFQFLNNNFSIDKSIVMNHIYYIILASILIKFLFIGLAGHYIDFFDLQNYIKNSILILNGGIPYINVDYEYGILSLAPMILSVWISYIFGNAFFIFQFLMILCDVITVLCIYLITLKLYNERRAYIASFIYILSLAAIYTVVTRYDSLPVCLMMVSILFFIYGKDSKSYIVSTLGIFTKVFPAVTLPFFLIHNYKYGKLHELKKYWLIPSIITILCIVPFLLLGGLKTLKPYIFATGSTITSVYANTFTFALYSWIHDVLNIPIDFSSISLLLTIIMITSILYIFYYLYKLENYDFKSMIKYICITLCILVICTKFHSPQYFMWFTPLMVIFISDKLEKIGVFFLFQIITFIEFPILFGSFYTNVAYTNPIKSVGWQIALFFFTIEYVVLFMLMYMTIKTE